MALWELLGIIGIGFIIFEIFTPSMFFLNFALASFICAILSLYIKTPQVLVVAFFVFSFISFFFFRPILVKRFVKNKETGLNSKYIGQVARVEQEVSENAGVITIYGERWEARSEDGSTIEQGADVKIVRNESIIMYVSKITK